MSREDVEKQAVGRMGKVSNIQVLRGLAALAVVLFHAREEVDSIGRTSAIPSFTAGAFGVDVFFVISGFVMVHASVALFGAARSALPFVTKRVARIVPLYWAVTLLFAVSVAHDPAEPMSRGAFVRFLATSLGFVPYLAPANPDSLPLYPLGWTLDYEMFFYASFAAVLALPRHAAVAVLTITFAALVALAASVALPYPLAYLGATQILEFVAGMLLAEVALADRYLPAWAAAALEITALVAVAVSVRNLDAWWAWRGIVWGLPAAALVGVAALRPPLSEDGAPRRWLERLGDASYALYLVHYGLFLAIEGVLRRLVPLARMPASLFMALLVAAAVAAAFAIHRLFEVPVTRMLQVHLLPRQVRS